RIAHGRLTRREKDLDEEESRFGSLFAEIPLPPGEGARSAGEGRPCATEAITTWRNNLGRPLLGLGAGFVPQHAGGLDQFLNRGLILSSRLQEIDADGAADGNHAVGGIREELLESRDELESADFAGGRRRALVA